jgi:hypothetical protein
MYALDLQAVFGDRVAMGAAGNEVHIVARGRHAGAEISTDCPRRHRCNTHD